MINKNFAMKFHAGCASMQASTEHRNTARKIIILTINRNKTTVTYVEENLTRKQVNDMERLTEKTIGCFEYSLKDHKPIVGEFGTYEAFFDYSMAVRLLGKYEDTGLEPEEIIKLQQERDYWELEAKRYCGVLGEQKIKLQKLKCEMCRLEDTGKCREC